MGLPSATYRLQFHERFRLTDATALVPYLAGLGISHIYASPLTRASPHSTHGYDVCDFSRINPEIGTEADLEYFIAVLRDHKMGLVVDIVPNHMGIANPRENPWWWDVLKFGQASRYAEYFDIDWNSSFTPGKIIVPILADDYETVLHRGELKIIPDSNELIVAYFDHRFPVFSGPTGPSANAPDIIVRKLNSNPKALDDFLQRQHYRLVNWRHGDARLNYRRFFTITSLAGVRVEDENVFLESHSLVKRWIDAGWIDGLRVDHPDGLRHPEQYFNRLRELAPRSWIVAEKILERDETLPEQWPIDGTTGYDFAAEIEGLFIRRDSGKALTEFYRQFTGVSDEFGGMILEKKRFILNKYLEAETQRLGALLAEIGAKSLIPCNNEQFRAAVVEIAAAFPVYRSYIVPSQGAIHPADRAAVANAFRIARNNNKIPDAIFDLIETLLIQAQHDGAAADFVARFQQLTGAAMAKGVEDTAFYCFNRFIALNEVGNTPACFGIDPSEFHEQCIRRSKCYPRSMLGSSTHDSKRSEDVRARLAVLSEIPELWIKTLTRWSTMLSQHPSPDRNMEYFFHQTLAGAWPVEKERIAATMEKAAREAREHTCWENPNETYESALKRFIATAFKNTAFIADVKEFVSTIADAGYVNSLAQTLVKLMAPGVPDIYQGNDLWRFDLVDPDNRRPVDFERRRRLLDEIKNLSAETVWKRRIDGSPKLWLIYKTLTARATDKEFSEANYLPLHAIGEKAAHVIAFNRANRWIAVIPRFWLTVKGNWSNTVLKLPSGKWRNQFGDDHFSGSVEIERLFQTFPVALLRKEGS